MHFTVCYITHRKEPMVEWFLDSFHRECGGDYSNIKLVLIDFWAQPVDDWTQADVDTRKALFASKARGPFFHIPPKPTVWQGQYRLAKINYFAASNARNTGLCMAPDGYLVYADDLSVLLPGWWAQVKLCAENSWIGLGTYDKVLNLVVENGEVKSFDPHPHGEDTRRRHCKDSSPLAVSGSWMFGCSVAIPTEVLLNINGFDEDCDSMSGEDYIAGIMMEKQRTHKFVFLPQMKTLESEERHFIEAPFPRIIKPTHKLSPYKDSSHVILNQVIHGNRNIAPNYQVMRETRDLVLRGEPFPIIQCPQHDWRDGQEIRKMDQTG